MRSAASASIVVLAVASVAASTARADGFDAHRFRPAAGAAGGFMVERPVVPRHLGFGAGLFLGYALNPVILRDRATDEVLAKPLAHSFSFDLLGSIGLFDFLELALHLPIHALYTGDSTSVSGQILEASGGLGDLRLMPKVAWWLGGWPQLNFSLGFALPFTFPTGDEDALRGEGSVTIEPRVLFEMGSSRWAATASLGYRGRLAGKAVDFTGPHELTYGLAGTFGLLTGKVPLDLQAEITGGWKPSSNWPGAPLELLLGAIVWPHPEVSLYAAVGPGLTNGVGTPDFRALFGVRFARRVPGRDRYKDTDADGRPDFRDDCPDDPEDLDGFEDEDGCPDADNDHDNILDDQDECPNQAEEPGGDGDGCPDKAKVVVRRNKVEIFGKIRFKTGSAELLPQSSDLLDQVAAAVKANPNIVKLTIEGHTDNVGTDELNLRLSQERADSVKDALVDRGVDRDRLVTKGYGESRPVAPNRTPAGRARNRRVEFVPVTSKK